jgi:hypothetical protein
MARLRYNGLAGTLGAALSDSATSVTLAAKLTYVGGDVPTLAAGGYFPLSILDADGLCAEVVYVTAYTAAATTATILRGRERSAGVAHDSGATFVHGPTALDNVDAEQFVKESTPEQFFTFYRATTTTVFDSTENRRNGTAAGGYANQSNHIDMLGTNGSVQLAGSGAGSAWIGPATPFVEVVFSPDSVSGIDGLAIAPLRWSLYLEDGVPKFRIYTGSAWTTAVAATTTLSTGVKYHIAAGWDGTNQIIYVNGVQEATSAPGGTISTGGPAASSFIGVETAQSDGRADGQMYHYAFYSSVLSAATVRDHDTLLRLSL